MVTLNIGDAVWARRDSPLYPNVPDVKGVIVWHFRTSSLLQVRFSNGFYCDCCSSYLQTTKPRTKIKKIIW